jgi:uncharacterized repeat protein (TIGR04138 family)
MQTPSFEDILNGILKKDPRYQREAYVFLREALDHTQKSASKTNKNEARHVSGQELLQGIREFALLQFGPMTVTVLEEWGVRRCEDFGELVFNLVEHGLLSKTEKDSRADFQDGYDFDDAFRKPFQPKQPRPQPVTESSEV